MRTQVGQYESQPRSRADKPVVNKHAALAVMRMASQIRSIAAQGSEVNDAFEWLERAYAQHDPGAGEVQWDSLLRKAHSDSRWQPFLKKMGLND
jgi:hypothetical protein